MIMGHIGGVVWDTSSSILVSAILTMDNVVYTSSSALALSTFFTYNASVYSSTVDVREWVLSTQYSI